MKDIANLKYILLLCHVMISYIICMTTVTKLNKKLKKAFDGKICAMLNEGVLYLTGELNDWNDIVRAGLMSVNRTQYTVVNDIVFTGCKKPIKRMPLVSSNVLEGEHPDVLVIGGGIIGCAVARELSRYKLNIMLVEKEHDVALHASGRNDGVINPNLDLRKGQLKKKYSGYGYHMYPKICRELDVPYKITGQYLCFTENWLKPAAIISIKLHYKMNGIRAEYINHDELLKREPNISPNIKFALYFPDTGVVDPIGLTIAYAENAADNGVKVYLDTAVISIDVRSGKIEGVLTNRGRIFPKLVINAAGVFSEEIARLANDRFFSIHPKRGTSMIMDKKAVSLVNTIVSNSTAVKGLYSKSGGIVHTIDNNLLVGPNTVETHEKEKFSTDKESIKSILYMQKKIIPELNENNVITYFTGIRAATYEDDFIVSFGKFTKNIIHAAGIQSPGLTAAPSIASEISVMAAEYLKAVINEQFNPVRRAIIRGAGLPDDQRDALIKKNPDYGIITCCCEEISRGEIIAAMRRSIPCDTVDGIKRRVRSGMGRCQGGYCEHHVAEIIAAEKKIPLTDVKKKGLLC